MIRSALISVGIHAALLAVAACVGAAVTVAARRQKEPERPPLVLGFGLRPNAGPDRGLPDWLTASERPGVIADRPSPFEPSLEPADVDAALSATERSGNEAPREISEDLMRGHLPLSGRRFLASHPGQGRGIPAPWGRSGAAAPGGAEGVSGDAPASPTGGSPGAASAGAGGDNPQGSRAAGTGGVPVRTGGDLPVYPRAARERGFEGETLLELDLDAEGRVVGVRIARTSGHASLDAAASEAAATWRFEPDPAGRATITLPVIFRLGR